MAESPPPSSAASLRLAVPCELGNVRPAVRATHRFLAANGCGEADVRDCDLALAEACNNAVQYAPANRREQPVLVEVTCSAEEIELRITDHTLGFAWPDHVNLPEPETECGRGLYLMRTLMNYSDYICRPEGNILVLRKKRAPGGLLR